jgi:Golgi apparatus protein 1
VPHHCRGGTPQEVFYYQLMEVNDFRNDVILAEACRADVDKYCKDVEPG